MKKRIIKKINTSKRNFLTGSVALAGVAAATSVLPISIATTGDKKKYKLTHKQVDKTVDSPCIQICTYDEEEEFCIGCYRTKQELQDWWIMTREQKLEALKKLEGGYED